MGLMQRASASPNYIDLLEKEFAYGGRGPEFYDCYGLIMEMHKRIGIELPEYKSEREPSLIQMLIIEGKKLFEQIEKPEPHCVVTFFIKPYITSHLGFMLDDKKFIHIMLKSRVTVERIDSDIWKDRLTGVFKWKQ